MPQHLLNLKGRITVFHVIVVSLSLILTLTAWQFSKRQMEVRIAESFAASRDRTLAAIRERMVKYEDALWAGVAAVETHNADISLVDWYRFAHTLRIEERHPGINGMGVIHYLERGAIGPYLAQQRKQRPDFKVFPSHEFEFVMPITYIEPEAINAAAIGLDVAHETNRRTAALLSRDTGLANITGPITLVQDAGKTPGFLFYAPFYSSEAPQTRAARRAQFKGAVYAPFVVHKLMEGLLAKDLRNVRFSIRDAGQIIYDEHDPQDPNTDHSPLFSEEVRLPMFGRVWDIDMRSDLAFRRQLSNQTPTAILAAGLMIEGLIIALLFLMARANARAVSYADRVTRDLQASSAQLAETNQALSAKNEELEQYAYVASHDLRTPIRGIGGLTEIIEEDLEIYFKSDNANPDVASNLKRIHERVARMQDLTQGILDYSQLTPDQAKSQPAEIGDLARALRTDYALAEEQLKVTSDVAQIATEPLYFRRVIENLVGNAVKYHDDVKPLRIAIAITALSGRCHVDVQDNGPGIAPEFHDRIFAVFQTLGTKTKVESTGIGLAVVKKLVAQVGGDVTLQSSPGQGATFSFDWPLDSGAHPSHQRKEAA